MADVHDTLAQTRAGRCKVGTGPMAGKTVTNKPRSMAGMAVCLVYLGSRETLWPVWSQKHGEEPLMSAKLGQHSVLLAGPARNLFTQLNEASDKVCGGKEP